MKISYLITCSTETTTLKNLFNQLYLHVVNNEECKNDEIIVLADNQTLSQETSNIIDSYLSDKFSIVRYDHSLNNNYGEHKNYGIQKCNGDFILQIDGDELPSELIIGENIRTIIKFNPDIEAFAIPRINDFKGVQEHHAKQWGWKLTTSPTYNRFIVNWPDFQFRIFKRDYPRISFLRRLHEKIEGYSSYVALPIDEEYALYHDKTIEKQVETNLKYNKQFTQKENQGHCVFGN